MFVHPQLDLAEQILRLFLYPAVPSITVWAVREYRKGQARFATMVTNTTAAVQGIAEVKQQVNTIEHNHLEHLQSGITRVAESNDEAVKILREINTGIAVLTDRKR